MFAGGGPDLNKKKGLVSNNNFAGSLKYVYYNDVSILYELKKGNSKVHYIGVLQPEFEESDVEVIPITYPLVTNTFLNTANLAVWRFSFIKYYVIFRYQYYTILFL